MTYIEYLQSYIKARKPGDPIYTNQIADDMAIDYGISKEKAAAAVSVAIKRIIDRQQIPELRCYRKGIYYWTVVTPFGEVGINKEQIIAGKYLIPDKGYETGLRLLHHMGLTTQIPAERLLATNAAKNCVRYDKRLDVFICPPKTLIQAGNKEYLQTLDALELLDKAPIDVDEPYSILADHIRQRGLQYETLLYYANNYYSRKTIIQLAHTTSLKEA